MKNSTIRKKNKKKSVPPKDYVLCSYGRLVQLGRTKAYCDLHKCYLQGKDIREKKCKIKKCKHFKNLGKYKDIEW